MTFQLQRLEGFYWVAKFEGYSRAARAFPYPISEPGVHQQVKRLESELKVTLFERTAKDRVRLTSAGQQLFDHVAPFYEGLEGVANALKEHSIPRLVTRATALAIQELLPRAYSDLKENAPFDLHVSEMRENDLDLLRQGQIDVLLEYFDTAPKDLEAVAIGVCRAFLIFPSTHARHENVRSMAAKLSTERFVYFAGDARLRRLQEAGLARLKLKPKTFCEADSTQTIVSMVAAGMGYSLVPSLAKLGPTRTGISSHRIDDADARFNIYATFKHSNSKRQLIEHLISVIRKREQDMHSSG